MGGYEFILAFATILVVVTLMVILDRAINKIRMKRIFFQYRNERNLPFFYHLNPIIFFFINTSRKTFFKNEFVPENHGYHKIEKQYKNFINGSTKANEVAKTRIDLGNFYRHNGRIFKAFEQYYLSLIYWKKNDFKNWVSISYRMIGLCYFENQNQIGAMEYFKKAFEYCDNEKSMILEKGYVLEAVGYSLRASFKLKKALLAFMEAHKFFRKSKNEIETIRSLLLINDIQFKLGDDSMAADAILKALNSISNNLNGVTKANIALEAGQILSNNMKYQKARKVFVKGLAYIKTEEINYLKGEFYRQLGILNIMDQKPENSLLNLQLSNEYFEKEKAYYEIGANSQLIGDVYQRINNYQLAMLNYEKAQRFARNVFNIQLEIVILNKITDCLIIQNQKTEAEKINRQALMLSRFSLFQEEYIQALTRTATIYREQGKMRQAYKMQAVALKKARLLKNKIQLIELLRASSYFDVELHKTQLAFLKIIEASKILKNINEIPARIIKDQEFQITLLKTHYYIQTYNLSQAKRALARAQKLILKNNEFGKQGALSLLWGAFFLQKNDLQNSKSSYIKAYRYFTKSKDSIGQCSALHNLGKQMKCQNKLIMALDYFKKELEISTSLKNQDLRIECMREINEITIIQNKPG